MVDLNVARESRSLDIALLSLYFPAGCLTVSGFDVLFNKANFGYLQYCLQCYCSIETKRLQAVFFTSLSKFIMVTLMG